MNGYGLPSQFDTANAEDSYESSQEDQTRDREDGNLDGAEAGGSVSVAAHNNLPDAEVLQG